MAARRNTRTFVEDDVDATNREFQRLSEAATNTDSSSGSSTCSSYSHNSAHMSAAGGRPSLGIYADDVLGAARSTGINSSSASTVSTYSSEISTPSGIEVDVAVTGALDERALDEIIAERLSPIVPGAPINFGPVLPGLFRSSYPKPENFDFLLQLNLKTIVTLVDKNYTEEYRDFIVDNGITHHMFAMRGTKKEDIPLPTMDAILDLVLDRRNHPMLIHCNQGRHRTGCVVAVVRKIAGWDHVNVTDEYRAYAGEKTRDCDINYILAFNLSNIEKTLASRDLDVAQLAQDSRLGEPANAPASAPTNAVGHHIPNFFRTAFFSMTVLIIWVVSGFKMPQQTRP